MVETPTVFPGQAPESTYAFRTGDGQPTEALYSIAQIIKGGGEQPIEALGTAFFITVDGHFVTAKHVLMDVLDEHLQPTHPLTLIQFLPDEHNNPRVLMRPITAMVAHRIADVAIGILEPRIHKQTRQTLRNKIWPICFGPPPVGRYVATYALPRTHVTPGATTEVHLEPRLFAGEVREIHPNGRDKTMLPGPCLHTSIHIHGGASGGPVFGENGLVFGVNSTGIDGTDVGFVSLIECIREMAVEGMHFSADEPPRRIPILELIERGSIVVKQNAL